jgi:hypothetical protein
MRITFLSSFLVVALLLPIAAPVGAQSESMQKALESVKGTLDDLVTAKDEQKPVELGLRIEALKKAINLSAAEAKELRVKLIAIEDLDQKTDMWRAAMADQMKRAAEYALVEEKAIETNEKEMTLAEVKDIAARFKAWRESSYLPVVGQVRDYFLIAQEEKTIETAKSRWQKIDSDIKKLEKAKIKNIESVRKMLTNADFLIAGGEALNQEAWASFVDVYISQTTSTAATSTDMNATTTETNATSTAATSTDMNATTTVPENQLILESSTSSSPFASSTDAKDEPALLPPPSIRDLVHGSLSKIKDTYKVFIDMSNLVRKLLK